MFKTVLIVAGGKGDRMKSAIPKQFLEIKGKPILMHTLDVFYCYDATIKIILVLPADQINSWEELCLRYSYNVKHQLVAGGESRFQSVKNGLEVAKDSGLIAVHDGVRPLVSTETIARCFEKAEKYGTAVPVINVIDSIRQITLDGNKSVDRSSYKLVQTPQVFKSDILKKAYKQDYSPLFTDDASVVEAIGTKIQLVEGNRENIKITNALDLKMAEVLLKFEKLKN
jgi:2-C-methyl-D-erythritol 4-phosphate cytidylyltransferase